MEKILKIAMEGGSHNIFREKSGNDFVFMYSTEEFIDLDEFPELADHVPTPPEIFENFEMAFRKITERFAYWPQLYFVFIKLELHQYIENQLIEYLNTPNNNANEYMLMRLDNWREIFGKEIEIINNKWQAKIVAEPKESFY